MFCDERKKYRKIIVIKKNLEFINGYDYIVTRDDLKKFWELTDTNSIEYVEENFQSVRKYTSSDSSMSKDEEKEFREHLSYFNINEAILLGR